MGRHLKLAGQSVGIEIHAFNVIFDIWQGNMNGKKNDPHYPPAPSVLKGVKPKGGGSCVGNNPDPSEAMALRRDDCFPGPRQPRQNIFLRDRSPAHLSPAMLADKRIRANSQHENR